MAVGDAHVFPGFFTPVLTQLFFPKPPTTFLTCFCRGERRKYTGKKSRLNRGSNSQPPGHEPYMLTSEPPGRGLKVTQILRFRFDIFKYFVRKCWIPPFPSFPTMFSKVSLFISVYLSSLPVANLSDAPRRRLVVTGDSARIQDETTECSACFFDVFSV